MRTIIRFIKNRIPCLISLSFLMACMILFTGTVFAAGSYSVSGTYSASDSQGGSVDVGETTYKIYHVADFDKDNPAMFKFLEQYSNVGAGLNFTKKQFGEEGKSDEEAVQWREAWMDSAETISNYVQESDLKGTYKSSDGKFQFTGLENGLYLLTGSSSEITDDAGNKIYLWPRPMYVMILNGDAEVSMKPASETAEKYTVYKTWEGIPEDREKLVKPVSIDVKIFYGGTDDSHLKETVTLDEGNDWTYSWYVGKDENDPSKWIVQEVLTDDMKDTFTVSTIENYSEETRTKVINIKNTYDRKDLEIVKTLSDYISQGNTEQGFVFMVTAYAGGKEQFSRFVGITFAEQDGATDKVILKDISKEVDRIVVKEVYSGNYTPDEAEKEAVFEGTEDGEGIWKVSFTNSNPDETPTFDTGIINKYSITGNGTFSFKGSEGSGSAD